MFSRFVKSDGEEAALFPFQLISHSFGGGGFQKFDGDREKRANQTVRLRIGKLKAQLMAYIDMSNPSAVQKAEHYNAALDAQLTVCDETDEFISALDSPITGVTLEEVFGIREARK
jgi:hypothetical protein